MTCVAGPSYTQVNRMSTSEEGEAGHSGQYEREPPPLDFLRQQSTLSPSSSIISLRIGVYDPHQFDG